MSQSIAVRQTAITLGFWSAILTTACTILWVVLALGSPTAEWSGIESYAKDFTFFQMANFIPVILLTIAFVVLMVCIHYVAPETKKVFTLIGIAFSSVYAAIICTNYYIQLFVVRLNLLKGDLDGLALLAHTNLIQSFLHWKPLVTRFLVLRYCLPV